MNKGTFAYALTEIDGILICQYIPKNLEISDNSLSRKRIPMRILPIIAGTLVIIMLSVFLNINKTQNEITIQNTNKITEEGNDNSTSIPGIESGNNGGEDKLTQVYGSMFFNSSENTSLLKVKSLRYHGTYYEVYNSLKHIIFEAEVETDYYSHLRNGDKVYVAFPVEFRYRNNDYVVSVDNFVQIICGYESIVFYTNDLNTQSYYYTESGVKAVYSNLCTCKYYRGRIIPVKNSIVDYTGIDTLFNDEITMQQHFENIQLSGYSIMQGDSENEMEKTINKLVTNKIFGGKDIK